MSSTAIKLLALVFMTLDHALKLYPPFENYFLRSFVLSFGSIAFPLFAFLFSDSVLKTKNRKRFLITLFVFALISELPFQALNALINGLEISFKPAFSNILFSFFYASLAWYGYERLKNILPFILFSIISILTSSDYNIAAISIVFFCCLFSGRARVEAASGILLLYYFCLLVRNLFNYGFVPVFFFPDLFKLLISQLSILIIHFYNGERGKGFKYLFYVYYPLHMAALVLLVGR